MGLTLRQRDLAALAHEEADLVRAGCRASVRLLRDIVNAGSVDVEEWVRSNTQGRGMDAVVVAASVKSLVPLGMGLLRRAGHISIFAGMPKSDPMVPMDVNRIHYLELNVHGANSSVLEEYLIARDYLASGKIDGRPLITHRFTLKDFGNAVKTQDDVTVSSLKIVITP